MREFLVRVKAATYDRCQCCKQLIPRGRPMIIVKSDEWRARVPGGELGLYRICLPCDEEYQQKRSRVQPQI